MKPITHSWSDEKHTLFFSLVIKHILLYMVLLMAGYCIYVYEVSSFARAVLVFQEGKSLLCKDEIISLSHGYSYDESKRVFFNHTNAYQLNSCTLFNARSEQ